MSGGWEAGRFALAGFLYQLAGSIHDALKVLGPLQLENDHCEANFALEQYGQDAVVSPPQTLGPSLKFIQYKYSGNPGAYPIDQAELIEILQAFRRSGEAARNEGGNNIQYCLVTNRRLNRAAETMVSKAQSDEPYDPLDKPSEESVGGRVVNPGRGPQINTELRAILKGLEHKALDIAHFTEEITQCASEFGLVGREVSDAIGRLTHFAFVKASSGDNRFTRQELIENLAGFPEPRSLRDPAIHAMIVRDLEAFKKQARMDVAIIRRSVLEQMKACLDRALIVVVGGGGTGKTVTLAEFVRETLTADDTDPKYLLIESAHRINEAWPGRVVSKWRHSNDMAHRHELIDGALARLETAAKEPLVILGLDAIDEVDELLPAYHDVQRLVDFFLDEERQSRGAGRPPRARLVVTCRHREELEHLGVLDRSGLGTVDEPAVIISVGDFSDEELLQLVDVLTHVQVANRLRQYIGAETQNGSPLLGDGQPPQPMLGNSSMNRILPAVYVGLKHPIIWRSFAALSEAHQLLVLDGAVDGLNELAKGLVQWFCGKVSIRHAGLKKDDTRAILEAVARRFDDASRVGKKAADWIGPVVETAGCSDTIAHQWFQEAISSGVIRLESRTEWRWRHAFVCEYLRTASDGTERQ